MDTHNDTRPEEIIDLGVATEETKGIGSPKFDSLGGQSAGIDDE